MRFFFSLYSKNLVAFLVVSLIPVFLLGAITKTRILSLLENQISHELQENANRTLIQLAQKVDFLTQNLDYWADQIVTQRVDFNQPKVPSLCEFLKKLSQLYGNFTSLYCVNFSGAIIASDREELIGKSIKGEELFLKASQGEHGISPLTRSPLTQAITAPIYIPIHNGEKIYGVLIGEPVWHDLFKVETPVIQTQERSKPSPSSIESYILDKKGFLVQAPISVFNQLGEAMFEKNFLREGSQAAKLALQGKSGILKEGKNGGKYLVAYSSMPPLTGADFNWVALCYAPMKEIFQPIHTFTKMLYLYSSALVVLIVLFSLLFASKISKPVKRLILATKEIATGKKATSLEITSRDEIGVLAKTFQEMEQALAEMKNRLVHSSRLAAVGELAAGVAHEINNPLTAVIGYAELLAMQVESKQPLDPQKAIEACKRISEGVLRCKVITDSLLRFARKEVQKPILFDLNEIIEESLKLIHKQLEVGNVTLVKQFATDLPKVSANKIQIQQVVFNLISNALFAMEAKKQTGTLTIATEFNALKKQVVASFCDTGLGISKENQVKVFQPFFTTKEPGQGTGLGLAVCYGIMKDCGGELQFESEENVGTTFKVIFPASG